MDRNIVSRTRGTRVALFERGDVELDASKILQHHVHRQTALQLHEGLDVAAAAVARSNLRWGSAPHPGAPFPAPLPRSGAQVRALGDECDELVVIDHLAVRTAQRSRVPLRPASSATI